MGDKNQLSVIQVTLLLFAALITTVPANFLIDDYNGRLIANNTMYAISIIYIIYYFDRRYEVTGLAFVAAAPIFISFSVISAFSALFIARSEALLTFMAYPIIAIGYYPQGPDAWFVIGVSMWCVAVLLELSLIALILFYVILPISKARSPAKLEGP